MRGNTRHILATGAALAAAIGAASCDPGTGESTDAQTNASDAEKAATGRSPHYGEDPMGGQSGGTQKAFEPKHFSVVNLRLADDGTLDVKHETHALPQTEAEKAIACVLREIGTDPASRTCPPKDHPEFGAQPRRGFADFNFVTQEKIYLRVEGDNIGFSKNDPISFSMYGPYDRPTGSNRRLPNFSFFNARVLDRNDPEYIPGFDHILYLENHLRGKDGTGGPPAKGNGFDIYSMNLHMLICNSGVQNCNAKDGPSNEAERRNFVPIIVDPDTGNGTGNGPPPP